MSGSNFGNEFSENGVIVVHELTDKDTNSLFGFENLNNLGNIDKKLFDKKVVSSTTLWDFLAVHIGRHHGVTRPSFVLLKDGDYFAAQIVENGIPVPAELVKETHAACLSGLPDGAKNKMNESISKWLTICAKYDEINRKRLISKSQTINQALDTGPYENESDDDLLEFNPNVGNQKGRLKKNLRVVSGGEIDHNLPYYTNKMKFMYDREDDVWNCVDEGKEHVSIVLAQGNDFALYADVEWDDADYCWKRKAGRKRARHSKEASDEVDTSTDADAKLLGTLGDDSTYLDSGELTSLEDFQKQLDKNKLMVPSLGVNYDKAGKLLERRAGGGQNIFNLVSSFSASSPVVVQDTSIPLSPSLVRIAKTAVTFENKLFILINKYVKNLPKGSFQDTLARAIDVASQKLASFGYKSTALQQRLNMVPRMKVLLQGLFDSVRQENDGSELMALSDQINHFEFKDPTEFAKDLKSYTDLWSNLAFAKGQDESDSHKIKFLFTTLSRSQNLQIQYVANEAWKLEEQKKVTNAGVETAPYFATLNALMEHLQASITTIVNQPSGFGAPGSLSLSRSNVNASSVGEATSTYYCDTCKSTNHNTDQHRKKKKKQQKKDKEGKDETGQNDVTDGTKKRSQQKQKNAREKRKAKIQERRSAGECFKCGEKGHYAKECPNQKKSGDGSKPTT
jgi:hypothetical protein